MTKSPTTKSEILQPLPSSSELSYSEVSSSAPWSCCPLWLSSWFVLSYAFLVLWCCYLFSTPVYFFSFHEPFQLLPIQVYQSGFLSSHDFILFICWLMLRVEFQKETHIQGGWAANLWHLVKNMHVKVGQQRWRVKRWVYHHLLQQQQTASQGLACLTPLDGSKSASKENIPVVREIPVEQNPEEIFPGVTADVKTSFTHPGIW